jgi:hypothetical protein
MPDVVETRDAIRGRSDTEILSWIESIGGTRTFLDEAFSGFREAFLPEHAGERDAVIEWDIRTPDLGVVAVQLVVERGQCRVQDGATLPSTVRFAIDMPDFLRLIVGTIDGPEAVAAGRLDVAGDQRLANALPEWFGGHD